MEYYIQGDAAKSQQIKAAFETKAIYSDCGFANENYLYYSCDGEVNFCFISGGLANVIKTHPDYQELELPVEPKFKVGDWIINRFRDICLITDIDLENGYYICESNRFGNTDGDINLTDKAFHLWTIADAKDGDVLATDNGWTCIFKEFDGCVFSSYCFMDSQKWFNHYGSEGHTLDSRINGNIHPATPKQRTLFFKKMQEAGYQWYAGKKELRKIKPHYDIANFHVGMPVLVREYDTCHWQWVQYSHFNGVGLFFAAGKTWRQCIPYDGNEHLLGTTDMPSEGFINW